MGFIGMGGADIPPTSCRLPFDLSPVQSKTASVRVRSFSCLGAGDRRRRGSEAPGIGGAGDRRRRGSEAPGIGGAGDRRRRGSEAPGIGGAIYFFAFKRRLSLGHRLSAVLGRKQAQPHSRRHSCGKNGHVGGRADTRAGGRTRTHTHIRARKQARVHARTHVN